MPVSQFADLAIPAGELWGGDAAWLEEQLAAARSASERVGLLKRFLGGKLRAERDTSLRGWVELIWQRRGDVAISTLCDELGVGERRLERGFRRSIGTSPKHFACITRFLAACRTLRSDDGTRLVDAAHACGYADQAHFNRDFKAFSGVTPREFLDNDHVDFLELEPPVGFVQDSTSLVR